MLHAVLPTNTQNTLKYHLDTAEPPFTVKMIDYVHQTGPRMEHSILQYVALKLYVYQVCHGVSRCVNNGSCSSSSLEWKSIDNIAGISYYLNKIDRCY